jgi:hypothetical protein
MPTVTFGSNTGNTGSSEEVNIYEGAPTSVQSAATELDLGKYSSGNWKHGLLKFDLSSLPSSITVSSARVELYLWDAFGGSSQVFTGYRLLRNWTESTATWNVYTTASNWGTAGGTNATDRSATPSSTSEVISTTTAAYYEILQDSAQLRSDIEYFAANPGSNFGWHLERTDSSNDSHYRTFYSADGGGAADGQYPFLVVTYTAAGGGAVIPGASSYYRRLRA